MSDTWVNRRRFVAGISSVSLAGIAGCSADDGPDDEPASTATSALPFSQSADGSFPSYSGTVSISGEDDYWSFKMEMGSAFGLRYSVTNEKSDEYDFDVFVLRPNQYDNYLQEVRDSGPAIEEIQRLSAQGVRSETRKSGELDPGTYFFVVDNTDIGDAGDFGSESTREVSIELETYDPANATPPDTATADNRTEDGEQSRLEMLKDRYPNWAFIDGQTQLVVLKPIEANAGSYTTTISGTIVNGSDTDYDYAQIEFGLYTGPNGQGAKVGNAIDNISGLESGQRWQFEAVGSADDASSFEIEDTTAY